MRATTARQWYRIAAATTDTADLYVFDEIGKSFWNDDAVTAKQFIDDLRNLSNSVRTIRVHVNSPGGDPFDATVIANELKAQRRDRNRRVEVSIEGLAASAATIVTCAGSPIRIAENALMMIHEPYALALGTAQKMREMADALDRVRDSIVSTYQWVSPKSRDELSEMMKRTTWMDCNEAIAHGFATEKIGTASAAAAFRAEAVAKLNPPQSHRARFDKLVSRSTPAPRSDGASPWADVYKELNARHFGQRSNESATRVAPRGSRTLTDIAREYYDEPTTTGSELIPTSSRGVR